MASAPERAALRDVRRGEGPGEIYFTCLSGDVLIVHAHGVHADEQWRTREAVLQVLIGAGIAEGGR